MNPQNGYNKINPFRFGGEAGVAIGFREKTGK
jgi:hypothetical protein